MNTLTPSHQHTRCWLALTAVKATMMQYRPQARGKLDAHVAKINRWAEACAEDIRHKPPSAGAKRDVSARCEKMTARMSVSGLDGDELFMRWAASVWVALTLLEDCRNVCPDWFRGRHWRYLLMTMTTLGNALVATDEMVPVEGTRIYEEVA